MKLIDGRISILINREKTTIELRDDNAAIVFAEIKLTPDQLSSALGRLSHTECTIEVFNLDKIGKKHENKSFEFEIDATNKRDKNGLHEIALRAVPEGWIPDNYYNSQNSFFEKDGKSYARCTIRRWI